MRSEIYIINRQSRCGRSPGRWPESITTWEIYGPGRGEDAETDVVAVIGGWDDPEGDVVAGVIADDVMVPPPPIARSSWQRCHLEREQHPWR